MAGPNILKDNAPKDGAAKVRPGPATPPPKSRPALLRVIGVLGGWIAARFKVVWRRTAAGVGAAADLTHGLMRWEAIAALGAVVAAAAAVFGVESIGRHRDATDIERAAQPIQFR